jgi:hypothetical protein
MLMMFRALQYPNKLHKKCGRPSAGAFAAGRIAQELPSAEKMQPTGIKPATLAGTSIKARRQAGRPQAHLIFVRTPAPAFYESAKIEFLGARALRSVVLRVLPLILSTSLIF